MTRNRRAKQDTHVRAAETGRRYTTAHRQQVGQTPLESIRSYDGSIGVCADCGQPAHAASDGARHFAEQAGAVYCPSFPAVTTLVPMRWHWLSLDEVKARYPRPAVSAKADCQASHHRDRFRDTTSPVAVCTGCGQPAYDDPENGPMHFSDQWDGIHCDRHPLADTLALVNLHPRALAEWQAGYECTYPHPEYYGWQV